MTETPSQSQATRFWFLPAAVILIGSLVLLFTRLGHYALWDDEAITAMTARSVWHTGDSSIRVDDHNLLVYRNGLLTRDFKDRYTPPLQFYLIAPFIGMLGDGNFACRLPFVLCGVITVILLLLWLRKINPPLFIWWAAAVILLTNAEFFLFSRQCRYYGLVILLSSAVAYFYCNRDGRLRWTLGLSLALAALLVSQYLDYAGMIACLVADYVIWGRRKPFGVRHWLIILLPQLIVGALVLSIWNMSWTDASASHSASLSEWVHDRFFLVWWNWRDIFRCDFGILLLILACPLLYLKRRSIWMLRAPMALFVFVTSVGFVVPTALVAANAAEVRYLTPAIPLCIAVAILSVWGLMALSPERSILKWCFLTLAAASILIEKTPEENTPLLLHSSALLYYHELWHPQTESYTAVINWINTNVPPGASIYVQPAYKNYPLMMRAGHAIYAWQLDDRMDVFTPVTPSPGESPTLKVTGAPDGDFEISVTNDKDVSTYSVAGNLIEAWNGDENAFRVATAKGFGRVELVRNPGMNAEITGAVQDVKTGKLIHRVIEPRSDFRNLPDIHFFGRVAPDYLIRFGSNGESADMSKAVKLLIDRGNRYKLVETVHLHWKDLYRPERIWHAFLTQEPKEEDEIHIYKRIN